MTSSAIVSKVWSFCTTLRDDGVGYGRLREISTEHPADITKMLARLVKDGFLVPDGIGRGMIYFVPWMSRPLSGEGFSSDLPLFNGNKTQEQGPLTQELSALTQELGSLTQELGHPIYVELSDLAPAELAELEAISASVREKGRVPPDIMKEIVLQLCHGRFLGLRILARLLNRDSADLSRRVLNPMVTQDKSLRRAFPRPNDPRQAYTNAKVPGKDSEE